MSDIVLYSSNYLTTKTEGKDGALMKCNHHFCSGHCQQERMNSAKTHLLFRDSIKNTFRNIKEVNDHISDGDMQSIFTYLTTKWLDHSILFNAKHKQHLKFIDDQGVVVKFSKNKMAFQREIEDLVNTINEELETEGLVQYYNDRFRQMPTPNELAMTISNEQQIAFVKAREIAESVGFYRDHEELSVRRNNEKRAFDFYLRYKVSADQQISILFNKIGDITVRANEGQELSLCDAEKRQKWQCEYHGISAVAEKPTAFL